ncbi:DUF3828 domain-containing protein [Brevundimonas staleyi]|uniref:DUF3828 domain-containing protein n=1 Tax=Brevundimonas staleyi TaxID=74326 RepID=A0ABW0FNR7_9CAUL
MRISIMAAGVAVLALAGCSASEEAAESPAVEMTEHAQTPDAFVRSLYSVEAGGTKVPNEDLTVGAVETPGIWSARTDALIGETEALGEPGEYAYFEADPICDCQDDGGMVLKSVTVTPTGANRADATVVLEWAGAQPVERKTQTFRLVNEGGAWKIDDIVRDQTGAYPQAPLVEAMTRWIAETRAAKAQ